jgi:hypothetical protein
MNVLSRLAAFVVGLGLVFGLAFVLGRSVGPEVEVEPESHDMGEHVMESAYALRLGKQQVPAGHDRTITFRVLDGHGRPLTAYADRHERDLHLTP